MYRQDSLWLPAIIVVRQEPLQSLQCLLLLLDRPLVDIGIRLAQSRQRQMFRFKVLFIHRQTDALRIRGIMKEPRTFLERETIHESESEAATVGHVPVSQPGAIG